MPSLFGSSPAGAIVGGVGGLLGGLLGSGPTVTNSNQQSNTQGETNTNASSNASFTDFLNNLINSLSSTQTAQTSTTTPNLSPATQQLLSQLTSRFQNLSAPSLTGYQAQQTAGINRTSDLHSQAIQNIMASRGLSASPVAGTAQAGVEAQRFGDITRLNQGIPLLQNQMNLANLSAAGNFLGQIPKGSTTTSGGTTDTTQQQSQAQTTGGQNFANQWGYSGTNQSNNTSGTQTTQQKGSAAAGIAGLLGGLFSDVRLKKEVQPSEKAVDKIMKLRPVQWKWKGSEVEDAGLLAQDLLETNPELVEKDIKSGYLKVNYSGLIGALVGAVQELKESI